MRFYYYSILNIKNNKRYLGITENIERRKKEHFNNLRNNSHCNYKLQMDWNSYSEESFLFQILDEKEFEDENLAYEYEKELICQYNSITNGYNIAIGGHVNPMYSNEIKEKMTKTKQSQVPNIYQLEEIEENIFKVLGVFNSQKEAQRITGCSQRNINRSLKENVKGSGYFWIDENQIQNFTKQWKPRRSFMNPVGELDREGNIIKVYRDCGQAATAHNWYKNNVSAAIQRNGTASGIKFIKIDEETYYEHKPITLNF